MRIPPPDLLARLDPSAFNLANAPHASLAHPDPDELGLDQGRRSFLRAAAGAAAAGFLPPANSAMVFNTDVGSEPAKEDAPAPQAVEEGKAELVLPQAPRQQAMRRLAIGEIPGDFWERPRELHLQRQGTSERMRIVYWRDGKLVPEGYWAACNLLRDVKAKMMTYMDPAVLDILRGILGYYEAWNWNYPIIITSGYRTVGTNNGLKSEGAAKNSMHLYGRAVDLYMQRIPVAHLGQLGMHFQRGGVGFYPQRGFVHLDTGRLRSWKG
ncbi:MULTISPECIES: YcbK family protein [unclassified Variovorax]|uniref:YcbK family protein n=1 Tax=unclassified Variovorax TaxID=663243 RepID=UPI001315E3AD|nr:MULTISPECIES: DUF882 domain-containing protein [unclassified Variovorax]VTU41773.1 Peptidase M15 [Variovorax sp. PBL-H6]VTU44546.1 Peptidase M15 [Variovorax sp. SRS16]VTU44589.1 Peptidase M15 [Variovorax sp. PBL-E5]